jgi:hypothetical protein
MLGVMAIAGLFQALQTALAFVGDRRLVFTNWDFPAFYAAGRLVADGRGHLLYDVAAIRSVEVEAAGGPVGGSGVLPFFNPAFFAVPFAPLSSLNLLHAYQTWTIVCVGLLPIDIGLLWLLARPMPRRWRWACAAAFVTAVPVSYGFQHGQFSLILVTAWCSGFLLLRARRDCLAGLAFAPLLIKPELLVPLGAYLLWKRRPAVFVTLVPLAAMALAGSIGVTGVSAAAAYPRFLLESTGWEGQGVTSAVMFGWSGVVAPLLQEPAALPPRAVVAVLMLLSLGLLGPVLRGDVSGGARSFAAHFALLTIATVLFDPHIYLQDTVLLALPAVALLAAVSVEHRPRVAALLVLGWGLLAAGNAPALYAGVNVFALYLMLAGAVVAAWLWRWPSLDIARAPLSPRPAVLTQIP